MIFDKFFEIGLLFLGFLYVGNMYFDSLINLYQISKNMDEDEKEKEKDKELKDLSKHLYN